MYYSDYYLEAKEQLAMVMENRNLRLSYFGENISTYCQVTTFFIEEEDQEAKYANMTAVLGYSLVTDAGVVTKTRRLRILSSRGSSNWTQRLKALVWGNYYPDTLAIDLDSGEVFLVNIYEKELGLVLFNVIPNFYDEEQKELTEILDVTVSNLDEYAPYSIQIEEKAMYETLDGSEGYRHLFRNIQLVLHANFDIVIPSPLTL